MIALIGATGRSGAALARALLAEGTPFTPVVRDAAKWDALGLPLAPRIADLTDPAALRAALEGASLVISTAHARHAPAILAAAPQDARFVLMGSTRRYSRWADAHGDGVRAGEAAFLASGRAGVMLHPTMVYGAEGEDNVQRLAALLRRLPFAPLPGGGQSLVQPIHQSDVTRALLAAARHSWTGPEAMVIAGPEPMPYRDFLAAVVRAAGLGTRPVLPLPAGLLRGLAWLTRIIPGLPSIGADEIRRLTEDKAFDIAPMRDILGVAPIPLEQGLALTFAPRLRRRRRALTWGLLLLALYSVTTCVGTMLISNQPPFWVLLGMAKVGVFMEFHDRGLPLPASFQVDYTRDPVPCFRDGAPDPELPGNRGCHPGIHAAEGSNSNTDMFVWWSKARVTGVVIPASLLESGFVSHRLIPYIEEPCRAVRDFDTVVMPHQRAREEARRAVMGGPVPGDRVVRGWIGQEIERIRIGFDCDGDGRPRPEFREEWMATTFRMHLYDLRGKTVSTIQFTPGWAQGAAGMRRLPRQFPPAAPLDPPTPRSHSSP